ncbi:hypothetical protein KSP40_PGU005447 [Platanthera guangdongensis]|uniref:Uncharacterized protein n=1 Tax=Platanthera guangdongensis TaxID=2320717 RepID=A0ABR2LFD7_9ASPA
MGNYFSCTTTSTPAGLLAQCPRVILPSGDIYHAGMASETAAEIMLDHTGYFIAHSSSILIHSRLFALSADEELKSCAVYAMFPMDRVGSSATAADKARLLLAATPKKTGRRARAQITPAAVPFREVLPGEARKRTLMEEQDDVLVAGFMFRRSLRRSKRPDLETITEEPFC